jgi:NAD(P)-dependent dehydrogenase (short-subunit alcohol dehydrogenase family)
MAGHNKVAIVTAQARASARRFSLALLKEVIAWRWAGDARSRWTRRFRSRRSRGARAGGAHRCDQSRVRPALFGLAKEKFGRSTCCSTTPAWARRACRLEDLTFEQWKNVVDINLTAPSCVRRKPSRS